MGRVWIAVLVLCGPIYAQTTFRINYDLQSTDVSLDQIQGLSNYVKANPGAYFLVQGFACDTGGFVISHRVAERRSKSVLQLMLRDTVQDHIQFANATVLKGEPRIEHRRLEIAAFPTPELLAPALAQANRNSDIAHAQFPEARTTETPVQDSSGSSLPFLLLILLLVLLLILAYFFWTRIRTKEKSAADEHMLSPEQAEAVHAITGQPVILPRKRLKTVIQPANLISPEATIEEFRSTNMASKKKVKPVPTIRKALDKQFETRSLGEIAKSPIHALQGLTPRHSKMLEEAFGIKTVEDLASLKYFELARAITVLARYEE